MRLRIALTLIAAVMAALFGPRTFAQLAQEAAGDEVPATSGDHESIAHAGSVAR